MKPVYISIDREEITGKYQVAIGDNDGGRRLLGPKFSGASEELERRELTLRDAEAIRNYLDAAFPNQDREALPKRRAIQICATPGFAEDHGACLYALCNDGTMWAHYGKAWIRLEPIPQDGKEEA